jgi:hypothetical protein
MQTKDVWHRCHANPTWFTLWKIALPTVSLCHSVLPHSGPDPPKCKEISKMMWLSLIWFGLVLFVCWNIFWTIANLRIKCVTETKNDSVLFYKNLKSSFLHDAHIWLWDFFTLLDALAHSALQCSSRQQPTCLSQALLYKAVG